MTSKNVVYKFTAERDEGRVVFNKTCDTAAEANALAAQYQALGFVTTIDMMPAHAGQVVNLVEYKGTRMARHADREGEKSADDIFKEVMERNKEHKERLAKERAKNNKSVTKSYDLKR